MKTSVRPYRFLCMSAVLLALPACGTEEVPPTPLGVRDVRRGANFGGFLVAVAPPELTFEQYRARVPEFEAPRVKYGLRLDGKEVTQDVTGVQQTHPFTEGYGSHFGYLAPGTHHFEIASMVDGRSVLAGDAEIMVGWETWLFVFGDPGALEGRLVSIPELLPRGTLNVMVMNLVRDGPGIEVVSCKAAAPCTPLSPVLSMGESFQADFPGGTTEETLFGLADGSKIGYRQVGKATLPEPPVQWIHWATGVLPTPYGSAMKGAPVYLSPEGKELLGL
jgi:hypothetical protein